MEDTSKTELKANIKKFQQEIVNYEGGNWTRSGTIIIAELKKFNLDAHTVVGYKYKDAERLRTVGKEVAEIFQVLKFVIDRGGSEEDFQQLSEILEKIRRLSVYDEEARDISTKALRIPTSVRYLEDEDGEDKDMAFDVETVERIQQARYKEAILRRATTPRGQQRGQGYGRGGMPSTTKWRWTRQSISS